MKLFVLGHNYANLASNRLTLKSIDIGKYWRQPLIFATLTIAINLILTHARKLRFRVSIVYVQFYTCIAECTVVF